MEDHSTLKPKTEGCVRIVVWNVCGGFQGAKYDRLVGLDPDIAVVPEACNEGRLRKAGRRDFASMDWIGRYPYKGLGVLGFGSTRVSMLASDWDQNIEWVLPAKASTGLNVFGVWAMHEQSPRDSGGRVLLPGTRLLDRYAEILRAPSVVAGDFNGHPFWDRGRPDDFGEMVRAFQRAGLVSAYHRYFEVGFGDEPHPTFWSSREIDRPFHIDWCFVPAYAQVHQVWVGNYADWVRPDDGSDHAPLVVDLEV